MKDGKRNTILLTIIGIATLLVAVVGATFAYFTAIAKNNTDATSTIKITSGNGGTSGFDGGSAINLANIYPRDAAWANKLITLTYSDSTTPNHTYNYNMTIIYTSNFTSDDLSYKFESGYCTTGVETEKTACGANWTANDTGIGTSIEDQTGTFAGSSGTINLTPTAEKVGKFNVPTTGTATQHYTLKIYFLNKTTTNQNADQGKTATFYVTYNQAV